MRKWLWIGLGLVAVVAIAAVVRYFVITPVGIDRAQNKVVAVPLGITPAAQALHATLDVADMHADSLLWKRDLLTRSDRGHIDLPRLIEGRYALQVFSSVTKSPGLASRVDSPMKIGMARNSRSRSSVARSRQE